MKISAFIMALLILVLPALPCEDAEAINAYKAKTEIAKQDNHQEEQHNDACSPFCHCTCCASFSLSFFFTESSFLLIFDNKSYRFYLPENIIGVSYSIWQPPKIS